ncbi:MAG: hypothetical protein WBE68_20575 [Candidatus Nitrosopolaris sp.]
MFQSHSSELICRNIKELVEHQHHVFDTLWNKSIPAEEKIREIEDGITPEFVGTFLDPFEVQRVIVKLFKSAKDERLMIVKRTMFWLENYYMDSA